MYDAQQTKAKMLSANLPFVKRCDAICKTQLIIAAHKKKERLKWQKNYQK